MKYRTLFSALLGSIFLINASAYAEWTGDSDTKIWSNMRIIAFSSGKLDGYNYFCLAGKNDNATDNIRNGCVSNNQVISIFGLSYDVLYKQAVYYYGTGQRIAMYYNEADFRYDPFSAVFKSNFIRGFSTCEKGSTGKPACFGPTEKK